MLEVKTYKNYKKICEAMGWKVKGGNAKQSQLKDLERYCKYDKEGNKFIVTEIYNSPLPKVENRGKTTGIIKNTPNFKVDKKYTFSRGVYKIVKDNQIYVGSTVDFRKRFLHHLSGNNDTMAYTSEFIKSGAEFSILWNMDSVDDVELMRMVEDWFIKYFIVNDCWDCINRKSGSYSVKDIDKNRKKIIRVPEEKYIAAIQLLIENKIIEDNFEEIVI